VVSYDEMSIRPSYTSLNQCLDQQIMHRPGCRIIYVQNKFTLRHYNIMCFPMHQPIQSLLFSESVYMSGLSDSSSELEAELKSRESWPRLCALL